MQPDNPIATGATRYIHLALLAALPALPGAAPAEGIRIALQPQDDHIVVSWSPPYGTLQTTPALDGPWMNLPGNSPMTLPLEQSGFFRVVDTPLVLQAGSDLYQGTGTILLELPPNFFGPGSDPFVGLVPLEGARIGSRGAFELGTTDVVIQRLADAPMPAPPSVTPVAIELAELSLKSLQPVEVIVGGLPQSYDVYVKVAPLPVCDPWRKGVLWLNRLDTNSGTFGLEVTVQPQVVFSNDTQVLSWLPGNLLLQGTNAVWNAEGPCPTEALRVPFLPLGFCMQNLLLHSPQLQLLLNPPLPDPTRPGPSIAPDAIVDPAVASIGRFAIISSGARIEAGVVIGPYAFIGENAVVRAGSLIGRNAVIGADVNLSPGVVIEEGSQVNARTVIEEGVAIGPNCVLGADCRVGAFSRLEGGCQLGDLVLVGPNVTCERLVTIGQGALLLGNLRLASPAQVAPGTLVDQDLLQCTLLSGAQVITNTAGCRGLDGWIEGRLADRTGVPVSTAVTNREVVPIPWNPTNPPPGLTNLHGAVTNAGAASTNGPIIKRKYVSVTYDCDDFADDMERALEAAGFHATFTVYYWRVPNPDYTWEKRLTVKPYVYKGHAVVDVHTAQGLIWIEPQNGRIGINLDFDGDGKVEYADKPGDPDTDDGKRIEVYESAAAARKAGVVMD